MDEAPAGRCGYTWPAEYEVGDYPDHQSCCFRKTLSDTDRCAWHQDPDGTDKKTVQTLRDALADAEARGQTTKVGRGQTSLKLGIELPSVDELLDGANLRGVELGDDISLSSISLRDSNLSEAYVSEADLSKAILLGADLSKADLRNADLSEANLIDADLSKADLRNADLSEANLIDADLSEAILNGADLSEAILDGADLSEADLPYADLSEAILDGADLSEAALRNADLSEAILDGADLSEADLPYATLSEADLSAADLSETTLQKGDFSNSRNEEADFTEADLEDAEFINANLTEATLTSADCEAAEFDKANLNRATLENADLTGATFSQAYLYQTRLTGAQINETTQFYEAGDIADTDTMNACRYDSTIQPSDASEAIEDDATETTDKSPEEARARRARSTYSRLEDLARENGFPELKSEMFVRRQDARRELLFAQGQWLKGIFAQVQKGLFRYGESFRRIIGISGATIVIWWVLYMITGTIETSSGGIVDLQAITQDPILIYDTLLQSIFVFASGNQVLNATNRIGRGIVVVESIIGPLLVALLIFVLGRRAAR